MKFWIGFLFGIFSVFGLRFADSYIDARTAAACIERNVPSGICMRDYPNLFKMIDQLAYCQSTKGTKVYEVLCDDALESAK